MSKTASSVMAKAVSFLGVKESPAGSNKVKFNTDFYGYEVKGAQYPWCCAYVWDVFRLADASALFNDGAKTAYCPSVEAWGKRAGLEVAKDKGKYGDLVLFDFGAGRSQHIGFIVQKNADGTYKTIEGNTSLTSDDNGGCVMYRTRKQSQIRCIIRPKYKSETTTTKKKEVPALADCNPNLKKGASGKQVIYLQADLNYVLGTNLVVDGEFGALTENALKKFQKKYGLVVDGVYGKNTKAALSKLLK